VTKLTYRELLSNAEVSSTFNLPLRGTVPRATCAVGVRLLVLAYPVLVFVTIIGTGRLRLQPDQQLRPSRRLLMSPGDVIPFALRDNGHQHGEPASVRPGAT